MPAFEQVTPIEGAMVTRNRRQSSLLRKYQRDMRVRVAVIGAQHALHGLLVQNISPCISDFKASCEPVRKLIEAAQRLEHLNLCNAIEFISQRLPPSHEVLRFILPGGNPNRGV